MFRIYLQPDLPRFRCEVRSLERLKYLNAPVPFLSTWGTRCRYFGTPFLAYPYIPGDALAQAASALSTAQAERAVSQAMATAIATGARLPVDGWGYLHAASGEVPPDSYTHHDPYSYAEIISKHNLLPPRVLRSCLQAATQHLRLVSTKSPGLVHPDLKPENILVSGRRVSLIDWELPVGGHPMLVYGGLLAEGLCEDALRPALLIHLARLTGRRRVVVVVAGLLRVLEAMSYLPSHNEFQGGRRVRRGPHQLALSAKLLLEALRQ